MKTQTCENRNANLKCISPHCLAQRKLVLMHHTINTHSQELYYQHHCKITVLKLNELCKFKGYDLRENKIWHYLYLLDFFNANSLLWFFLCLSYDFSGSEPQFHFLIYCYGQILLLEAGGNNRWNHNLI